MQESGEMYLETIWVLSKKKNRVRAVDISEEMNFSKPSVSRAMKILKEEGQILIEEDGSILLTDTGKKKAKNIYDRHTTLTETLLRLGVDRKTAEEDACRLEHYISEKSFKAIKKYLKENPVEVK